MRTIGNILWHIPLMGFLTAGMVFLAGSLLTITVVAAPLGLGLIEYGKFLMLPFGHSMVSESELNIDSNAAWKLYSGIIMLLWLPFGICIAIFTLFQVVGLFISIIGIPSALVILKSLGAMINPVGKKCVSID